MMEMYDIYIAFVSWGSEGKRRPILILDENAGNVKAFNITTQYDGKSEAIRAKYFTIADWKQAGLDRPSFIDTNKAVLIPLPAIDSNNPIGKLSEGDELRLIEFMSQ
jgi:hypothetical protein